MEHCLTGMKSIASRSQRHLKMIFKTISYNLKILISRFPNQHLALKIATALIKSCSITFWDVGVLIGNWKKGLRSRIVEGFVSSVELGERYTLVEPTHQIQLTGRPMPLLTIAGLFVLHNLRTYSADIFVALEVSDPQQRTWQYLVSSESRERNSSDYIEPWIRVFFPICDLSSDSNCIIVIF
mgnify:CR=1 FL=1